MNHRRFLISFIDHFIQFLMILLSFIHDSRRMKVCLGDGWIWMLFRVLLEVCRYTLFINWSKRIFTILHS
ncbi:hypothetical protein Hanom_Chr06g00512111 [Helianthus anomalus]